MLRRDRTATEFMVGLGQIPGRREESAESIKRGFLQALLDTADINEEFTDAILTGTAYRSVWPIQPTSN